MADIPGRPSTKQYVAVDAENVRGPMTGPELAHFERHIMGQIASSLDRIARRMDAAEAWAAARDIPRGAGPPASPHMSAQDRAAVRWNLR